MTRRELCALAACLVLCLLGAAMERDAGAMSDTAVRLSAMEAGRALAAERFGAIERRLDAADDHIAELEKMVAPVTVDVSAYNAVRRQTDADPQRNAIMRKPKPGLSVAVSRDLAHLLGQEIWLEGLGVRQVDDLMHPRYERRVDILMPGERQAREFGVRRGLRLVSLEDNKGV